MKPSREVIISAPSKNIWTTYGVWWMLQRQTGEYRDENGNDYEDFDMYDTATFSRHSVSLF